MERKTHLVTTGERIGIVAKQKGINLHKLADLAGIPYNTLYSIVKRKSERVALWMVFKIAEVLETNVNQVLGDEDQALVSIGYAMKERDTNLFLNTVSTPYENEIIRSVRWLNDDGQKAAAEYIGIMAQMDQYRLPQSRDYMEVEIESEKSFDFGSDEFKNAVSSLPDAVQTYFIKKWIEEASEMKEKLEAEGK